LPSYAFNPSGSPLVDHRNRLGGPGDILIILLTLCECFPERLPCLVEYLKVTQLFPRPHPRITSHVYNIYETIPPLDTTWYTIWAKVIVIVATYRRVVTMAHQHEKDPRLTKDTRPQLHTSCWGSGEPPHLPTTVHGQSRKQERTLPNLRQDDLGQQE